MAAVFRVRGYIKWRLCYIEQLPKDPITEFDVDLHEKVPFQNEK